MWLSLSRHSICNGPPGKSTRQLRSTRPSNTPAAQRSSQLSTAVSRPTSCLLPPPSCTPHPPHICRTATCMPLAHKCTPTPHTYAALLHARTRARPRPTQMPYCCMHAPGPHVHAHAPHICRTAACTHTCTPTPTHMSYYMPRCCMHTRARPRPWPTHMRYCYMHAPHKHSCTLLAYAATATGLCTRASPTHRHMYFSCPLSDILLHAHTSVPQLLFMPCPKYWQTAACCFCCYCLRAPTASRRINPAPATTVAHAPVPHASVRPAPRSHTTMRTCCRLNTCMHPHMQTGSWPHFHTCTHAHRTADHRHTCTCIHMCVPAGPPPTGLTGPWIHLCARMCLQQCPCRLVHKALV